MAVSRKKLIEYAKSFACAFIVFAILYIFLWPVRIIGVSMEPALNHNDRVFVSRALGFIGAYGRGDMVMVKVNYSSYRDRRYIIKRIIAEPGDKLLIENGRVYVNDLVINYFGDAYIRPDLSVTLADGHYFIMGDNSAHSLDSRDFGAIERSRIVGTVLFRFFNRGIFNGIAPVNLFD